MSRRITLEDLTFTFRCQESWQDMDGGGAVRHCGSCDKDVFDLSAMRRADAEALLRETEGKICVRLFRTPDGRVVTADDHPLSRPVATCGSFSPLRLKPRRRALWRRLSTGAAAAAVVLQPGACEEGSESPIEPFIMGAIAVEPMTGEPAWEPEGELLMGDIAMPETEPETVHEVPPSEVTPMLGRIAVEVPPLPELEQPHEPSELEPVTLEKLLGVPMAVK